MRSDADVYKDMRRYAKIMRMYANVCEDMHAKICDEMQKFAKLCEDMRMYAKICKKSTKRASQGGIESGHEHGKQRVQSQVESSRVESSQVESTEVGSSQVESSQI